MQTNTILTNLDAFLRTPAGAYAGFVGFAAGAVLLWFALQPVLDWVARRCAWCRRLGQPPLTEDDSRRRQQLEATVRERIVFDAMRRPNVVPFTASQRVR